jgi:hypothetical protein
MCTFVKVFCKIILYSCSFHIFKLNDVKAIHMI